MKLRFVNIDELDRNLKATVHRSGKLGFTVEAAKKLSLGAGKGAAIALNEDEEGEYRSLYIVVHPDPKEGAFKISKAGAYYYINAKPLFESLKIDYITDSVVYDISVEEIDGQKMFKLKRRETDKKKKEKV